MCGCLHMMVGYVVWRLISGGFVGWRRDVGSGCCVLRLGEGGKECVAICVVGGGGGKWGSYGVVFEEGGGKYS